MIYALAIMSFVVLGVSSRVNKNMKKYKARGLYSKSSLLKDLPSVSVCIPARNETHAMVDCLERVLASKYPKLEIIVIDDESVDTTPTIVKSFAHDGVRFIAGGEVPEGWLGKNHALDVLMQESSGTYVLFLDVDTKIQPDTIGQLVAYATESDLSMMSVLPMRADTLRSNVLFAPLRYFWRVVFSSSSKHPVAASSAWMVNRRNFKKLSVDFANFKTAVEPEMKAAELFAAEKTYKFLVSDELLGVSYDKRFTSQIETGVRLRFPMLKFSVVRTALVMLAIAIFAIAPYGSAIVAIVTGNLYELSFAVVLLLLQIYTYDLYLREVWKKRHVLGAGLISIILIEDILVTFRSAIGYLSNTITWKGRPISRDVRSGK